LPFFFVPVEDIFLTGDFDAVVVNFCCTNFFDGIGDFVFFADFVAVGLGDFVVPCDFAGGDFIPVPTGAISTAVWMVRKVEKLI
jgi:hypothetical protein